MDKLLEYVKLVSLGSVIWPSFLLGLFGPF